MPQARIKINGVLGSNTDLPINTLVQLDNQNIGGESTYNWTILDQPPGTADTFSSPTLQNPTFTPKKEGTYLIELVVNQGLSDEQKNRVVVGILQLKTRERIPAAGETTEADTADGWALANNAMLRRMDLLFADPGILVGVAGAAGLVRGDVLRCTALATIKTGLPGQEQVPSFTKALATTLAQVDELLVVLESGVDGSTTPASGALIKVRYIGKFTGLSGTPAVGDPVYVSDTGVLTLAAGTVRRQLGSVARVSGGLYDVWCNGVGGADITPIDRAYLVNGSAGTLTNGVRVDGTNATGLTNSIVFKAGNAGTVPLVAKRFSSAGTDPFQVQSEAGGVLARFTRDGQLTLDAEGISVPTAGKHITFGNNSQKVVWPDWSIFQSTSTDFLFANGGTTIAGISGNGAAQRHGFRAFNGTVDVIAAADNVTGAVVGSLSNHAVAVLVNNVLTWQVTTAGKFEAVGGNRLIGNVADPTAVTDVATKGYADAAVQNLCINGRFDFWQRGTLFTQSGTGRVQTADRWHLWCTSSTGPIDSQFAQTAGSGLAQFPTAARIQRSNGSVNTDTRGCGQEIDRRFVELARGQKITLTFWARRGVTYSAASGALGVVFTTGTGAETENHTTPYTGAANAISSNVTLTTSYQRFTVTSAAVLGSTVTTAAVKFSFTPTGIGGVADWFEITGVQVTVGTAVPEFVLAGHTMSGELAHCQRYYEKSYDLTVNPGTTTTIGAEWVAITGGPTNNASSSIRFKVTKRAAPTVTMYNAANTTGNWVNNGVGNVVASASDVGLNGFYPDLSAPGSNIRCYGQWVADAEI